MPHSVRPSARRTRAGFALRCLETRLRCVGIPPPRPTMLWRWTSPTGVLGLPTGRCSKRAHLPALPGPRRAEIHPAQRIQPRKTGPDYEGFFMFNRVSDIRLLDLHPDRLVRSGLHLHTSTYVGKESLCPNHTESNVPAILGRLSVARPPPLWDSITTDSRAVKAGEAG
jgi:hypothetical protein